MHGYIVMQVPASLSQFTRVPLRLEHGNLLSWSVCITMQTIVNSLDHVYQILYRCFIGRNSDVCPFARTHISRAHTYPFPQLVFSVDRKERHALLSTVFYFKIYHNCTRSLFQLHLSNHFVLQCYLRMIICFTSLSAQFSF